MYYYMSECKYHFLNHMQTMHIFNTMRKKTPQIYRCDVCDYNIPAWWDIDKHAKSVHAVLSHWYSHIINVYVT